MADAGVELFRLLGTQRVSKGSVTAVAIVGHRVLIGTSTGTLLVLEPSSDGVSISCSASVPKFATGASPMQVLLPVPQWNVLVCATDQHTTLHMLSSLKFIRAISMKGIVAMDALPHASLLCAAQKRSLAIMRWQSPGLLSASTTIPMSDSVRAVRLLTADMLCVATKRAYLLIDPNTGAVLRELASVRGKIAPLLAPLRATRQAPTGTGPSPPPHVQGRRVDARCEESLAALAGTQTGLPYATAITLGRTAPLLAEAEDAHEEGSPFSLSAPPSTACSCGPFVAAATDSAGVYAAASYPAAADGGSSPSGSGAGGDGVARAAPAALEGVDLYVSATRNLVQRIAMRGVCRMAAGCLPLSGTVVRSVPAQWSDLAPPPADVAQTLVLAVASPGEVRVYVAQPLAGAIAALCGERSTERERDALALCSALAGPEAEARAARRVHVQCGMRLFRAADYDRAFAHLARARLPTRALLRLVPRLLPSKLRAQPVAEGEDDEDEDRAAEDEIASLLCVASPSPPAHSGSAAAVENEASLQGDALTRQLRTLVPHLMTRRAKMVAALRDGGRVEGLVDQPLARGDPRDPLALLDTAIVRALLVADPDNVLPFLEHKHRCRLEELQEECRQLQRWEELVQLWRGAGDAERALSLLHSVVRIVLGNAAARRYVARAARGRQHGAEATGAGEGPSSPERGGREGGPTAESPPLSASSTVSPTSLSSSSPAASPAPPSGEGSEGEGPSLAAASPLIRMAGVRLEPAEARALRRATSRAVAMLQRLPASGEELVRRHARWALQLWPAEGVKAFTGEELEGGVAAGEAEDDVLFPRFRPDAAAAAMDERDVVNLAKEAAESRHELLVEALEDVAAAAAESVDEGGAPKDVNPANGTGGSSSPSSAPLGVVSGGGGGGGAMARLALPALPPAVAAALARAWSSQLAHGGEEGSTEGEEAESGAESSSAEEEGDSVSRASAGPGSSLPSPGTAARSGPGRRVSWLGSRAAHAVWRASQVPDWEVNEAPVAFLQQRVAPSEGAARPASTEASLHNEFAFLLVESAVALIVYRDQAKRAVREGGGAVRPLFRPDEIRGHLSRTRRALQDFLSTSQHVQPAMVLTRFPEEELLHEKALLFRLLGRHEDALSIYVHDLRNLAMAEQYCAHAYDPGDDAARDVYLKLATVALRPPARGEPGLALALPGTRPSATGGNVLPALLRRHADKLDAVDTVASLPDDLPLHTVTEFLHCKMRELNTSWRASQVHRRMLQFENLRVRRRTLEAQRGSVTVDAGRLCPVCSQRVGKSAFYLYPNGVVVHLSCATDRQVCPATGERFGDKMNQPAPIQR